MKRYKYLYEKNADFKDGGFDGLDAFDSEKDSVVKHCNFLLTGVPSLCMVSPCELKHFDRQVNNVNLLKPPEAIVKSIGEVFNFCESKKGICFAIAPKVLLTCYHLIDETKLSHYEFRFQGMVYKSESTPIINKDFDIAMIFVNKEFKHWLQINPKPSFFHPHLSQNHETFIILCLQRIISGTNEIKLTPGFIRGFISQYMLYPISTQEGDSGSPILDENGFVIGIHRRGGNAITKLIWKVNIGIRLDLWLHYQHGFYNNEFRDKWGIF